MEKSALQPGQKVEVGKYYRVPVAVIKRIGSKKEIRTPIIGEKHIDSQFGFDHEHYHIDGRFTSGNYNDYDTDKNGLTNVVVVSKYTDNIGGQFELVKIEYQIRKCKRLTTGLRLNRHRLPTKYENWYKSMIGKKCRGKKCPHFGYPMEDNGDGLHRCPIHDLHAKDGTIVNHPLMT